MLFKIDLGLALVLNLLNHSIFVMYLHTYINFEPRMSFKWPWAPCIFQEKVCRCHRERNMHVHFYHIQLLLRVFLYEQESFYFQQQQKIPPAWYAGWNNDVGLPFHISGEKIVLFEVCNSITFWKISASELL